MYGSSYLIAPSGKDSSAQIDLILSVDNTFDWHKENLSRNPSHYSGRIRLLGTDYLVNSTHQSVGIHYNPFVKFQNCTFKYGVIHHEHLKDDLQEWNTFYVAGRMQKPVKIIQECEEIQNLMETNYRMAAITAGMMVPSLVHESDLYMAICKLSYYGDRRLEDPKKVKNLVFGNLEKFKEIYRPIVFSLKGLKFDNEFLERSPFFYENVNFLPNFLKELKGFEEMNLSERTQAIEDVFSRNNSKFSTKQIIHTLKTGNFWQIFKYSLAKLRKALK